MKTNSISEIQEIAQRIDYRINLFDGFYPKNISYAKNESLFWREIVSIYGLFADCDSIQIRDKSNLFGLLCQYSFISKEDYDIVRSFWRDISALRKWFCHNTDSKLYYQKNNLKRIENFLDKAFVISTEKPKTLEQMQDNQWPILVADIDRRWEEYFEILKRGLVAWENSELKLEAVGEWVERFSKTLFENTELKENVLADMALFEIRNFGIDTSIKLRLHEIDEDLKEKGFSSENINKFIKEMKTPMSNRDIMYETLRHIRLSA